MLLKKNKHLYDSDNFNNYVNIYTIQVDENRVEQIIYDNTNNPEILQHRYDKIDKVIHIYFLDDPTKKIMKIIKSLYKIIYGHFYNAFNDFLFKRTINKKIINTNVYRCNKDLLLKNKEGDLIYTKYYDDIKEHREEFLKQKELLLKKEYIKPIITFGNNIINILSNGSNVLFNYNNECIKILNKKKI